MSINLCMFSGNIGKPGELRYTTNGTAQLTFSLAVNRGFKNKTTGEWENDTEWINCVVWKEQAERLATMLEKGTPIAVQARQQTRSWTDDQGTKHYKVEHICDRVEVFGKRPKQGEQGESEGGSELPWE